MSLETHLYPEPFYCPPSAPKSASCWPVSDYAGRLSSAPTPAIGNWQPTDLRATNLQETVTFAKKWELDGVVLASEPFVLAPQLVGFVKGKGMACATFGLLNDEVEGATVSVLDTRVRSFGRDGDNVVYRFSPWLGWTLSLSIMFVGSLRRLLKLGTNERIFSDTEDRDNAACILT